MRIRRRGIALLLSGGLCLGVSATGLVVGVTGAHAEGELGSGLGLLSLTASSGGQRVLTSSVSGQASDSGVPYAESIISGARTAALASAAWPGGLVGNAGSLLGVLYPAGSTPCVPTSTGAVPIPIPAVPIPPELQQCAPVEVPAEVADRYTTLNTPIRAEADNGSERDSMVVPGASMLALATENWASADAVIGTAGKSGFGVIGTTRAQTRVEKTGIAEAVATAESEVEDVFLLGIIKIDSVTSLARAVTNGTTGTASGRTVVTGMSVIVNGSETPVIVDGEGVHAAGSGTGPVVGPASTGVRDGLAQAGLDVFITEPKKTYDKKTNVITYDAGSLIIATNEVFGDGAGMAIVFGGARVTAASSKSFDFDFDFPLPQGNTGGNTGTFDPGTPGTPGTFIPGTPGTPGTTTGGTPVTAGDGVQFTNAASRGPLTGGVAPGWIIGALLGAALLAAGFKRLPDKILDAPPDTCTLGGPA